MNLTVVLLSMCGIVLISVICTKTRRNRVEGFKMPKMPSIADITRPILTPIRPIQSAVTKLPKSLASIEKGFTKQINQITKQIQNVETKIVGQIIGGFNKIFDLIKQAVSFVLFFPQCFLWYFLNIVGYVIYAPVAFMVWMFGMQVVEKVVFKYIEFADKWAHVMTGVHLFHFSDEIQARCYFSKSKLRDLRRERAANNDGGWSVNDPSVDDSEIVGYCVLMVLVGVFVVLGISAVK